MSNSSQSLPAQRKPSSPGLTLYHFELDVSTNQTWGSALWIQPPHGPYLLDSPAMASTLRRNSDDKKYPYSSQVSKSDATSGNSPFFLALKKPPHFQSG